MAYNELTLTREYLDKISYVKKQVDKKETVNAISYSLRDLIYVASNNRDLTFFSNIKYGVNHT